MNPDQISGEFFYNLTFRSATQAFLTSTPPPCPYERPTSLPTYLPPYLPTAKRIFNFSETSFLLIFGPKCRSETKKVSMKPS